ncbi:MAG: hypothetical protein AAGC56_12470, partial [Pseudomonadota bacterium]
VAARAAFASSRSDGAGQAALAALAASDAAANGDPVAAVVVDAALATAGLQALSRRLAFETALQSYFGTQREADAGQAAVDQDRFAPSLKPQRRGN